ncbi:hypothetical protein EVAR_24680_1 [Eumeta japonica]|uniref:Uncharacterized protein n=1 Tax=Eumeta variegata TaxID=151549 RepID=A0A4C1WGW7_EUMVA|nr:hypothetical protein EVAR_24680_1 [Eumeta japonica]
MRGKRSGHPSEIKWSPPPNDTYNSRGVIGALLATWESMGYLMERDRDDGEEERGVGHGNNNKRATINRAAAHRRYASTYSGLLCNRKD